MEKCGGLRDLNQFDDVGIVRYLSTKYDIVYVVVKTKTLENSDSKNFNTLPQSQSTKKINKKLEFDHKDIEIGISKA